MSESRHCRHEEKHTRFPNKGHKGQRYIFQSEALVPAGTHAEQLYEYIIPSDVSYKALSWQLISIPKSSLQR